MNLRGTDLNLLTVFEAVYEERSQLKAAERLSMSQPAISNALRRLKLVAEDPLFLARKNIGVQPTPRADEIYEQIHHALELVRTSLVHDHEFDPAESRRQFSLSIIHGDGSVIGPPLYHALGREAPNTRLSIHAIESEKEAIARLRDRSLDILVHYNKFSDPRLAHELIDQHQLIVIARRGHPRLGESLTPEQALQERFAMVEGHFPGMRREAWFDRVGERIALQVPSVMVSLVMVAQTDLLAFTSRHFAETFGKRFDIKRYPVPWENEPVPMYMIWHRSAQEDPAHRWFREKLKECVQQVREQPTESST